MKTKYTGFTLIELMVVISIMALLLFGGLTAYRDFQQRQELENAYQQLKTGLALARQKAESGEKVVCSDLQRNFMRELVLDGYLVKFSEARGSAYIKVVEKCSTSEGERSFGGELSFILLSSNDRPNVIISNRQGDNTDLRDVLFKTLGQGTNLNQDMTLVLEHTVSRERLRVVIDRAGNVNKQ